MTYSRKVLFYSFKQYINQIFKDAMLVLLCIAPILCGLFFKYGIPFLQSMLAKHLGLSDILSPYYFLFDLMLAIMTPLLYCFASAYLILGEIDEGVSKYMAVTPLGKKGYLISRLGFPTCISFVVTIVALSVFSLTQMTVGLKIGIAFLSALMGFIEALLIVSISSNRVEGMAVSKLSGLLILGIPAPFFIIGRTQYLLFVLPSFWASKYAIEENPIFMAVCLIISTVWIVILYKRFRKKIM